MSFAALVGSLALNIKVNASVIAKVAITTKTKLIPSDKFNRGIGMYAGKRYTVNGDPFEGSDDDWENYLNEILPTDADEKLLMEEYMAPGVEWIQYREWKQ